MSSRFEVINSTGKQYTVNVTHGDAKALQAAKAKAQALAALDQIDIQLLSKMPLIPKALHQPQLQPNGAKTMRNNDRSQNVANDNSMFSPGPGFANAANWSTLVDQLAPEFDLKKEAILKIINNLVSSTNGSEIKKNFFAILTMLNITNTAEFNVATSPLLTGTNAAVKNVVLEKLKEVLKSKVMHNGGKHKTLPQPTKERVTFNGHNAVVYMYKRGTVRYVKAQGKFVRL